MKRKLQGVPPVGIAAATMTLGRAAADAGRPVRAARRTRPALDTRRRRCSCSARAAPGVAFLIFYTLIAEIGPGRATVVAYIAPGFSVVYGVALLGEPLHRRHGRRPAADPRRLVARRAGRRAQPKRTFPFERARACARSMKSRRLSAARSSRVTSRSRAFSERRLEQPLLGLQAEVDGRGHRVGGHRVDALALGLGCRSPARRASRRPRGRPRRSSSSGCSALSSSHSTVPAG